MLVPRGRTPPWLQGKIRQRLESLPCLVAGMVVDVVGAIEGACALSPPFAGMSAVCRERQELWRGEGLWRGGGNRGVIRDQRWRFEGAIRGVGESRRCQRSLNGTVDGGESVDRSQLSRAIIRRGIPPRVGRKQRSVDLNSRRLEPGGAGSVVRDRVASAVDHGCAGIGSFHSAAVGSGGAVGRREASSLAVHAAVPPILDGVVAAVAESAGDFGPALAHLVDHAFNHQALLGGDGLAVQRGLQVLMESFAALLGRSEVHVLGDANPVVGALFPD